MNTEESVSTDMCTGNDSFLLQAVDDMTLKLDQVNSLTS